MTHPHRVATVLVLITFSLCVLTQEDPPSVPPAVATVKTTLTNSAVQIVTESSDKIKADVLENVKAATDGIHLAIQSGQNHDTSKMLKGIGDAVSVLPGALGFAGIAFSVAASVFAVLGGGGNDKEDPVLTALHELHTSFSTEMNAIQTSLEQVNTQIGAVISGIDRILSDISDVPAKVVAEMKLTDVVTMKDKFASVQIAAQQYAGGNLTRAQMTAKCDDFAVAALFSELGTVLKDEKGLLATRFGTQDRAHGLAQARLLLFYLSVVPVVTNCNALKYSLASIQADGEAISALARFVYARIVWYLAEPDRTVHVREIFSPFQTMIAIDTEPTDNTFRRSLSFQAYSFAPPHAACFEVVAGGKGLASRTLATAVKVPNTNSFCTKDTRTDDAPDRIVYAERIGGDGRGVSIVQPEIGADFDRLDERGWTRNVLAMYARQSSSPRWLRLPRLHVISDLVLLQAANTKVSVDEITAQCRALGDGYDRAGDAHSKDYSSAPWTIICVQSQTLTLREVDSATKPFLSDVQFNDMEARAARSATCVTDKGFVRDAGAVTLPSKIQKQFFGGASTVRAFAVCLQWTRMTSSSTPSQFVDRVWLDDSAPMAEKPKVVRHTGDMRMALPTTKATDA